MLFQKGDCFKREFHITANVYEGFITSFNDRNPLHINEQYAISHGFKNKVMHGNILCGFISFFIGECLPVKDVIIHSQEIQFKKPVYLNDKLQFEAEVLGVYESVNAVEFKFGFSNNELMTVAKGKFQIGILK